MIEVNGRSVPVMDIQMTMDHSGTYGSFTTPTSVGVTTTAFRPGDHITITGHGSPIVGIVARVRWTPTVTEVEWINPGYVVEKPSAAAIIDRAARELATRRPA